MIDSNSREGRAHELYGEYGDSLTVLLLMVLQSIERRDELTHEQMLELLSIESAKQVYELRMKGNATS